jgi:centractin
MRRAGRTFTTSAEMEIVRQMKEKCCVVALNPSQEEHAYLDSAGSSRHHQYTLPDGSSVDVGPEAFRAPEILFNPSLIGSESRGVADCLVTSIMRCDMDIRKTLFSQVVLSGGSTLFHGFGERLLSETRKHPAAPKDTKIRIAAPPERLHTTWIGGSILAALSTFKTMWVTKQEYLEHGNRLLLNS